MTALEQKSRPYISSFISDLLCGLTFYTSACPIYTRSYIANIKTGFKKESTPTPTYNSERIAAYAIKGTPVNPLKKAALFRTWLTRIGGIALVAMGLSTLLSALLIIV